MHGYVHLGTHRSQLLGTGLPSAYKKLLTTVIINSSFGLSIWCLFPTQPLFLLEAELK